MPANNRPLILDGALGTELMRRGINLPLPLWSAEANIVHQNEVTSIHKDYIEAGADIISTNTFRSTSWTYRRAGFSSKRAAERAKLSLMKAVESAHASNAPIIAGSITSVEDCYEPSLFPGIAAVEDSFGETLSWFREAGLEIILFETMGHIEEIKIAIKMAKDFKTKWLSMILNEKKSLLSGHSLDDIFSLSKKYVDCLLLNCNSFVKTNNSLRFFLKNWDSDWGVYPNLGLTDPEPDGAMDLKISDKLFSKNIKDYINKSPKIIGSCCGSSPSHTAEIKKIVREIF